MRKKLLCSLVALMFLFTSFSFGSLPVLAAQEKSLEEAIATAKKGFTVPAEYNEFTSNYNEYGQKSSWWLNWSGKTGNMNIEVDAKTGDILEMYKYAGRERGAVKLPKLSYQETKAIADALVQKLQPQKANNLIIHEDRERPALDINPWGPPRYNFRYNRVVEGIPFPRNGINITVNGDTGEILNYNFDWYSGEVSVPNKLISAQEAQEIYGKEFPLELVYFRTQPEKQEDKGSIKLVYQLRNPGRVKIDPSSGKVVKPEESFGEYEQGLGNAMAGDSLSPSQGALLTPEEEKEVAKMDSLISKDEAIKSALKVLKLGEEYELDSSGLQKLWNEPGRIAWQFSWRMGKNHDVRGHVNAAVDGKTGELLSFHRYRYDEGQGRKEPVYTQEQSKELAWQLLKELQPDKVQEIKHYDIDLGRNTKPARSYNFVYERMVNDVPFPQNGFDVRVNAVTGQIESYNLRWSQADFPKVSTVVDSAKATAWYGEEVPLTLEFVIFYSAEANETKALLLYHLKKIPYTMLDAVSGMPLNWRGEPLEKINPAIFTDISNHPAQEDIKLLVLAGIIEGTNDGKFHPNAAITQGEFAKLLSKLEWDHGPIIPLPILRLDANAWYAPWVNDAVTKGLIKVGEVAPEETVRKEFLAASLIRYLGLEQAAALSDLYKISFADEEEISSEYRGHVALADGLKIISSEGQFQPQKQITRGEAVTALVKTLQLE